MSLWQIGSDDVLVLKLREPLLGVWTCLAQIDTEAPPTVGSQVIIRHTAEDGTGTEWRGTAIEAMPHLGRSEVYLVGGVGGLRKQIPARHYRNVTPRIVAEDILRECGEAGPPAADLSGLDGMPVLRSWTRTAPAGRASGSAALTALCRAVGAGWRMRRNGTVVVGPEQWPAHAGGDPWVERIQGGQGRVTAAPDRPDVMPGTVLDGRRVMAVEHTIDIDDPEVTGYRAHLTIQEGTGASGEGRERDFFRRAVLSTLPRLELCRLYAATVQAQSDDGLLDVTPDDTTMATLTGVPILGLPGFRIKVAAGARVLVGCLGGWRHEADESAAPDEVEHFAGLWATDQSFLEITIDDGDKPIARKGDTVHGGWLLAIAPPGGGPITWQYFPADTVPPPPPAPGLIEISGALITSGAEKVKA